MSRKSHGEVGELLNKWEEAYKKGLLSFWLLLLLYERPSYAYELGAAVSDVSQGTVTADDKSIYRALNRFQSLGLVQSELLLSKIGPQRRYYRLTEKGMALLTEFTRRNILVFESPSVTERIRAVLKNETIFVLSEV
jgi:PadR family transcriptional regulator, regulatory protein PadR